MVNIMSKPTILCVDDERFVLVSLRDFLEQKLGGAYAIELAESGEEVLELLHELALMRIEVPLIVCDQIMPGIKGDELLTEIHRQYPKIRKVMLTGQANADAVGRAVNQADLYRYLAKPWDQYDLELTVREALNSFFQEQALSEVNSVLQELNVALERKVEERTEELQRAYAEIAQLNECLQEENLRLGDELKVARKLQKLLLPTVMELVDIPDLEIAGVMETATEVGGDYYDVLHVGNRTIVGIGDVAGHGLESGIMAVVVQTAVRTLVELQRVDYAHFFKTINLVIGKNLQRMGSDRHMTLCLLDYQEGELRICGQHEHALVIRAVGTLEIIDTLPLGFLIGLVEDIHPYLGTRELRLDPRDVVVLYTDGITEAENPQRQLYGLERLSKVAVGHHTLAPVDICRAIMSDVRDFTRDRPLFDDMTLVVLKRKVLA